MKLAIIGLGRMGFNMAKRLLQGGHAVVVFNRSADKVTLLEKEGAIGAASLADVATLLEPTRIVWLMLPAGRIIDDHIDELGRLLTRGDIIIDGGNSDYHDDLRRSEKLAPLGIHYLDAGVSGGIWGLKIGYCTMIGGEKSIYSHVEPIIRTLAPEQGYLYCGGSGAGHFVKMVHNGIEYALMEAYGEGFQILKASAYGQDLDLTAVASLWNHGSVIRSWLLELLGDALAADPQLDGISGYVEDSGEARWTVKEAIDSGVAADVMAAALFKRFNSRQKDVFANKVIAALRNQFGGHAVERAGEDRRQDGSGAGTVRPARAGKAK